MLSAGDAERVAELMRETAAAELLPRFRNLPDGSVQTKTGPLDMVTEADVAAFPMLYPDTVRLVAAWRRNNGSAVLQALVGRLAATPEAST